jgi:tetratricopeptide (TPR) repeat protein
MREQYLAWIDQVVTDTLKGQIRSKEQLVQRLSRVIEPGTGEVFEQCLVERIDALRADLDRIRDELKQAKLSRQLRALTTLQDALGVWLQQNQRQSVCADAVQRILAAPASERLLTLVQILDPNQPEAFRSSQIQQLSAALQQAASSIFLEAEAFDLRQLAQGLNQGMNTFTILENYLVSWLYEGAHRSIGFGEIVSAGPWSLWEKQVDSPLVKAFFALQAKNQSAAGLVQGVIALKDWVELWIVLRGLQMGLVTWFDQQPYSVQGGRNLAGVTFLVFASLWSELNHGFQQAAISDPQGFAQTCFQMTLQILRAFAKRENFPLYGGVFASFSGEGLRDTITYLDQPLKSVENTQEKARILTVFGYTQRWVKQFEAAIAFHQEALTLARTAGDQRCAIANLNHLSYLRLQQQQYSEAIAQAQQALILARQTGDRLGEAHALANLGYCEVIQAWQDDVRTAAGLEIPMEYLQRGLELSTKLQDGQPQGLAALGLGIAYVAITQPIQAQAKLEQALVIAQTLGDRTVQALSCAFLGEALYQLGQFETAVYPAALGMYWLEQLGNGSWRQAAALLTVLKGQLRNVPWSQLFEVQRSKLISQIGVDGFDYLESLLERYQGRE